MLLRFFYICIVSLWWKFYIIVRYCMSLPNSMFSGVMLKLAMIGQFTTQTLANDTKKYFFLF